MFIHFLDITDIFTEKFMEHYGSYTTDTIDTTQEEDCYIWVCDPETTTTDYSTSNDYSTTTDSFFPTESATSFDPKLIDVSTYEPFETTTYINTTTVIDYENCTLSNKTDETYFVKVELTKVVKTLPDKEQLKLSRLCWETMFGQELVKLTVMDLVK